MLEGAGPIDLTNAPARIVAAAYEGANRRGTLPAPHGSLAWKTLLAQPSSHAAGGAARGRGRASPRGSRHQRHRRDKTRARASRGAADEGIGADIYGHEAVVGPEELVAWAHIPVLGPEGVPLSGLQVSPLLQLPLMLSADRTGSRIEGSKVEVRVWVGRRTTTRIRRRPVHPWWRVPSWLARRGPVNPPGLAATALPRGSAAAAPRSRAMEKRP